jgi:hypothetical protein
MVAVGGQDNAYVRCGSTPWLRTDGYGPISPQGVFVDALNHAEYKPRQKADLIFIR